MFIIPIALFGQINDQINELGLSILQVLSMHSGLRVPEIKIELEKKAFIQVWIKSEMKFAEIIENMLNTEIPIKLVDII